MSINLTNEEAMVLSKLAYMNIADEASFKRYFKGAEIEVGEKGSWEMLNQ